MFKKIKGLFKKKSDELDNLIDDQLASAILLIEVSYSDFKIDKIEVNTIINFFEKEFSLSNNKARWLSNKALDLHKDENCLRKYIKFINENYNKEKKIKLINMAWKVAKADNVIDKYEEHRIRKLSELLYISHKEFVKAKINSS